MYILDYKSWCQVKKDEFLDARFALQPDGRTGIETLTLTDGDKVTLTQSGCEYFILKFKFETSRFAADTTNVPYWGNAALSFMRKIEKGLDVPLDVDSNSALVLLRQQSWAIELYPFNSKDHS